MRDIQSGKEMREEHQMCCKCTLRRTQTCHPELQASPITDMNRMGSMSCGLEGAIQHLSSKSSPDRRMDKQTNELSDQPVVGQMDCDCGKVGSLPRDQNSGLKVPSMLVRPQGALPAPEPRGLLSTCGCWGGGRPTKEDPEEHAEAEKARRRGGCCRECSESASCHRTRGGDSLGVPQRVLRGVFLGSLRSTITLL